MRHLRYELWDVLAANERRVAHQFSHDRNAAAVFYNKGTIFTFDEAISRSISVARGFRTAFAWRCFFPGCHHPRWAPWPAR